LQTDLSPAGASPGPARRGRRQAVKAAPTACSNSLTLRAGEVGDQMDLEHLGLLVLGIFLGANIGLIILGLLQAAGKESQMRHWSEAHDRWVRIHRI
jgi:hypothetical protein